MPILYSNFGLGSDLKTVGIIQFSVFADNWMRTFTWSPTCGFQVVTPSPIFGGLLLELVAVVQTFTGQTDRYSSEQCLGQCPGDSLKLFVRHRRRSHLLLGCLQINIRVHPQGIVASFIRLIIAWITIYAQNRPPKVPIFGNPIVLPEYTLFLEKPGINPEWGELDLYHKTSSEMTKFGL